MRIFLTGITGFLGSHLARFLEGQGHQITALIRKNPPEGFSNIRWITGDLRDDQLDLSDVLENTDAVLHLAGLIKAKKDSEFFETNTKGSKNLVREILKIQKTPRLFLGVSTLAVHALTKSEDALKDPEFCSPKSIYGKSKRDAEIAWQPLKDKLRLITLRPPALYGPYDRAWLPLFRLLDWRLFPLYEKGAHLVSFCYVEDTVRAITALLAHPDAEGIFSCDDGVAHSWASVFATLEEVMQKKCFALPLPHWVFEGAATIAHLAGRFGAKSQAFSPDKIRDLKHPYWVCGYKRLSETTGWKPKTALLDGFKKTLAFYRAQGWIS